MNGTAFQIVRICLVLALVCVAAALATPKGRLPLALRGLAKLLRQDDSRTVAASATAAAQPVPLTKRLLAFLLILLALLIAMIGNV